MRQRLPEDAGYPLTVADISRVVHPGEEFDAPHLVPGCVSLEPPPEAPAGGGESAPGDQPAPDSLPKRRTQQGATAK
jgi:hypothetical protein